MVCGGDDDYYSVTVGSPAETAGKVNAFLGGHLDEEAMRAAVDASLYRNRSKT